MDGSHSRSPTRDYEQIHDPIYNAQRASPRTEITQSFEPSKGLGLNSGKMMTRNTSAGTYTGVQMKESTSMRPLSSKTLVSGQAKILRNSAIIDRTRVKRLKSPPRAGAPTATSLERTRSPARDRDRSPATQSPIRGLKRPNSQYEPRNQANVEHYFNPLTADTEEYIKHGDIPPL